MRQVHNRIRAFTLILMMVLFIIPTKVYAGGVSMPAGENLSWSLEGTTLVITGTGAMNDFSTSTTTEWYGLGSSIENIIIGDGITSIGDYAFRWCQKVKNLVIPDSVTSIGAHAFEDCLSLKTITIPDSVTSIGEGAFYNCEALESIAIPDSVTSIGKEAFITCDSLKRVKLPSKLTAIKKGTFQECSSLSDIEIPATVTEIGENAFYKCASLTKITIPSGVEILEKYSFASCGLKELVIPEGVKVIGTDAFAFTGKLETLTIGSTVTSIKDGAFASASKLTAVYFKSKNPPTVEDKAFLMVYGATGYYPSTWKSKPSNVYFKWVKQGADENKESAGAPIGATLNEPKKEAIYVVTGSGTVGYAGSFAASMKTLTVPATVKLEGKTYKITSITANAFKNNKTLKKLTIGSNVKTIGNGAFSGCKALTTVTGGKNLVTIKQNAFINCPKLKSVSITSKKLKTIEKKAFYKCKKLSKVTLNTSKLSKKTISTQAFKGIKTTCTFKVPKAKIKTYKKLFVSKGASKKIKVKKN